MNPGSGSSRATLTLAVNTTCSYHLMASHVSVGGPRVCVCGGVGVANIGEYWLNF